MTLDLDDCVRSAIVFVSKHMEFSSSEPERMHAAAVRQESPDNNDAGYPMMSAFIHPLESIDLVSLPRSQVLLRPDRLQSPVSRCSSVRRRRSEGVMLIRSRTVGVA